MFVRTLLSILAIVLLAGMTFTFSQRRSSREETKINVPATSVQTGRPELGLKMKRELAKGFQRVYKLAELPHTDSIDVIQMGAAQPGESAKGVVVVEKYGELYLDSTPCESQWDRKQVFTFNKPYVKEAVDDQLCTNPPNTYKRTKVTQQRKM